MTITSDALKAFNRGNVEDAIALLLDHVKQNPNDIESRFLLCELWCVMGQIDRADKQLETISMQDPATAAAIALFRQLIRAETARRECWSQGRVPELLSEPTPITQKSIELWIARREQDTAAMTRLVREIEEMRVPPVGSHGGNPISDLRDLNDFTSHFFETLTSTGKYYWIPIDSVESLAIHAPKRPRDLIWAQTAMAVRGGPDGEVYLPVNYLGSTESESTSLRLGRESDWVDVAPEVVQGIGQRMFLLNDDAVSILQLDDLELETSLSPTVDVPSGKSST